LNSWDEQEISTVLTLAVSDMTSTMKALNAGLSMEGVTMYLFWLSTVAMGAGAFYFWLQRQTVAKQYQTAMTVAGIICAVAAFHYWRMSGIYLEGVASLFDDNGQRIAGATIKQFPTTYRYIDWIITVPLLVMEFPLLLNMGKKGGSLFRNLVVAAMVMLVTAWVAEESPTGGQQWWTWYIVSCAAWLFIVYMLYTSVSTAMQSAPPSIAASLSTMRLFVAIGWIIYPVGFLMALSGSNGESWREVLYNIADVINKVFFGLVCYQGVKALEEKKA
jgi:bacteriorhodopsin